MRLHEYLARTGVDGSIDATLDTLRRLHVAHREAFLFENLSIQEGNGVSVLLEDVERKFLDEARGGYCFEHNTMFAAVLREIGFAPIPLLARVRRGPAERWARTHMVLKVPIPERSAEASRSSETGGVEREASLVEREALAERHWLADVGFGAVGLIEPMPLENGAVSRQRGLVYSLRKEGRLWILSMTDAAHTADMYEFSEDPQTLGDVIVANHYTSTHPESMFRRTLTIQGVTATDRIILRNETLTRWSDGRMTEETVDRAKLADVARDLFGVSLPAGPFVYEK